MTKEEAPEKYQRLFDIPVIKRSQKGYGSGYYKYKIIDIRGLDNPDAEKILYLDVKGYHNSTKFTVRFDLKNDELIPHFGYYFTSVLDYFVTMEKSKMVVFAHIKIQKQYLYELNNIKNKYPEYFL